MTGRRWKSSRSSTPMWITPRFPKHSFVKRGSYDYRLERQLSDADVAALQSRFPELGITPVLGAFDGGYSIAENLADMSKIGTETYYSYYKAL